MQGTISVLCGKVQFLKSPRSDLLTTRFVSEKEKKQKLIFQLNMEEPHENTVN